MESMCRSWGMVVETFTTAQELMVRIRTNNKIPDLVLASHEMSGIDGIMLARLLVGDTRLSAVSFLIPTHNPDQARIEMKNIGRSYVINKPLRSSQLLTTIQQTLIAPSFANGVHTPSMPKFRLQRVLVAEDVKVNQRLVLMLLKDLADTVDLVENGAQAVVAVEKNIYDCVLMDCQMPEMDGYQATKNIRDREQRLGLTRLPIIALTAHAMQGAREHCLAAGMDDYLTKPLRENDLNGLLERRFGQVSMPVINKTQPAVDPLAALRSMLGEENIRDVAQAVVEEYPRLLADIDHANEVGDSSRVARISHSLKGSGAGLEMNELQEAARVVELNAKKISRENMVPLVAKLKSEAERAITIFRNFLSGPH
jgi:two-component system, sensor histidine kinase and response regulator